MYHMRNVIGRENLITCGPTNELAHALLTDLASFPGPKRRRRKNLVSAVYTCA